MNYIVVWVFSSGTFLKSVFGILNYDSPHIPFLKIVFRVNVSHCLNVDPCLPAFLWVFKIF